MIRKFAFGKVKDDHTFKGWHIVEYYPHIYRNNQAVRGEYEETTMFSVEGLNQSFHSYDIAVIGILCHEYQGLNHNLTYPIARMLEMLGENK